MRIRTRWGLAVLLAVGASLASTVVGQTQTILADPAPAERYADPPDCPEGTHLSSRHDRCKPDSSVEADSALTTEAAAENYAERRALERICRVSRQVACYVPASAVACYCNGVQGSLSSR